MSLSPDTTETYIFYPPTSEAVEIPFPIEKSFYNIGSITLIMPSLKAGRIDPDPQRSVIPHAVYDNKQSVIIDASIIGVTFRLTVDSNNALQPHRATNSLQERLKVCFLTNPSQESIEIHIIDRSLTDKEHEVQHNKLCNKELPFDPNDKWHIYIKTSSSANAKLAELLQAYNDNKKLDLKPDLAKAIAEAIHNPAGLITHR